jgi:hypothetical protein
MLSLLTGNDPRRGEADLHAVNVKTARPGCFLEVGAKAGIGDCLTLPVRRIRDGHMIERLLRACGAVVH